MPPATPTSYLVPRTSYLRRAHLWLIAPLALIWIFMSQARIEPFDFWWNVVSGRIMSETGRFLGTDVLVYTPVREPYSNPQWGSQGLFYAVYALSPLLMLTVRVAIVTATYAILFAIARRAGGSWAWAGCAVVAAYFAGFTNYGMRPQLFAFLPFIGFFWALEHAFGPGYGGVSADPKSKIQNPKFLWLLPLLMIVWVNVHGSFFLGLILMGAYVVGAAISLLATSAGRAGLTSPAARGPILGALLPLGVTALATLVNPYTWQIYNYVLIATGDATARALNIEWQPPTLYNGTGILFYANVGLFGLALLVSRRLPRPTEALLWLAFGGLALLSIRNVLWWGWITAPGLAISLATIGARLRAWLNRDAPAPQSAPAAQEIPLLNWLLAGVLTLTALAVTPLWRPADTALDKTTPVAVADFLARGQGATPPPPGPLFNYMEWGGYLEWRLYPQQQMFIDGRFEARQPQVWDDYLAISRGAATWQQRLDTYHVRTLVLNKAFHQELIPLVRATPVWRQVYEDGQALVFTRQ